MYVSKIKLNKVYRGYFMSNDKAICHLNLRGTSLTLEVLHLIGHRDPIFTPCARRMILGKHINSVAHLDMSNEA